MTSQTLPATPATSNITAQLADFSASCRWCVASMPRGSLARPLSDDDLEDKLRELCRYGGSRCAPRPLIDAVWNLEDASDVGRIMALAAFRIASESIKAYEAETAAS